MVERIKLMKNSSDNIGYRKRDLPACSAVLQRTAKSPPLLYQWKMWGKY